MFLLCAVRDVMAHPEAYACIRIWGLRKWIWHYRRFKEIRIPVRILGELKTGQGIMSSVAGFGQIYDTHSDDRSVSQVTQLDCLVSVLCLVSRNYFSGALVYTGLLPVFIVLPTSITSSSICPHLQGFAIPCSDISVMLTELVACFLLTESQKESIIQKSSADQSCVAVALQFVLCLLCRLHLNLFLRFLSMFC